MKQCCKKAIKNYRHKKALENLQKVAKFDISLTREQRIRMVDFIQGLISKYE